MNFSFKQGIFKQIRVVSVRKQLGKKKKKKKKRKYSAPRTKLVPYAYAS